jgi:hypothetical protein
MPHRLQRLIDPIVQEGLTELQKGAPLVHTLREVILMGAFLGAGLSPREAMATVERYEPQLIGMGPWEAREPLRHPGLAATYGLTPTTTAPTWGTKSAAPIGWGAAAAPTAQPMGASPMTLSPWAVPMYTRTY